MCRIGGILSNNLNEELLINFRDTMSHGGPNGSGIYICQEDNIGIVHRRLAIIDLSTGGNQPMHFKEFVISFNGEIYNFNIIRNELINLGYEFETHSDTEVILKAFDKWGYDSVNHFRGMFAFAIWNKNTKKLLLCRDRFGVKPLYYYFKDDLFMFSSELKAFHVHPLFDKSISSESVSLYLQTGYIRSPFCIFKYAKKLLPGSFLEVDKNLNISLWKYWDIRQKYLDAVPLIDSDNGFIKEGERILRESFQLRMVSDVPVGMFLSGGIDSSLVKALLQSEASLPLNTFTIGFENEQFNEAKYAKEIANHLGTNHNELYCTEKHFEETINYLPDFYDEPFGDSSAIPTYLVSNLAREKVTVSLSADAGDEIFAGYNRYYFIDKLYPKISKWPMFGRKMVSKLIDESNIYVISKLVENLPLPTRYKKNIDARLPKLSEFLKAETKLDFLYASTLFITPKLLKGIHNTNCISKVFDKDLILKDNLNFSAFCVLDMESYLEGDILAKVDRATMRVGLEGREPFLDHKIVEFALSLPDNLKLRNGETKWLLRQILYKYVPKDLIERPKMGFGIPLDKWLSSILRDDLNQMVSDKNFFLTFELNQHEISTQVEKYLNNSGFSSHFIWYLYCLHKWYKKWM